jgi:signal transduction histidine kinase
MGQSTKETADRRAHTDASLGAERATSDADSLMSAAAARSLLDDLIERDRMLADIRLLKFRDRIDRTLSRQRSDSLSPGPSIFSERIAADHRSQTEREMGDELLQRERDRSDVAVATERTQQQTRRGTLDTRRLDTDDQLSTERRGADSTLVATRNALAEAKIQGERRHDILGVVAHDLRSPLTVISMSADNVAELSPDPVIRISCHAITLAVARMDRLLSDLLDMARIDSGTLRIVKRQHDIGALLAEIHGSYEPLFTARHIAFVIDVPAARALACFDHDRIVQVLSNLLGNAMKFTPSGGAVTLRAEFQEEQILFTVSDNGPGIPAAVLKNVFEPFRQIDCLTRRGLGLGLYICKNIVQAHGGNIWAVDDVGQGATFRFTLPLD